MAGTRKFSQIVEDVSAAISSVTGTTCYMGKARYPDSQNLQDLVRELEPEKEAYVITWLWQGGRAPVKPVRVIVRSLIFINLPKDKSSTCEEMYDFLDEIVNAVTIDASYRNGVIALETVLNREDDELQDSVAVWQLDADLQLPPACL